MFGAQFENNTIRRITSAFGTLFNDIKITRHDKDGNLTQTIAVPIHFAPVQKYIAMLKQDPDKEAPAMILPRMSFELMSMAYDPTRKLGLNVTSKDGGTNTLRSRFPAAPYNLEFQLNIMVKNYTDGTKIIEQILPYFTPQFSIPLEILDGEETFDITVELNNTTLEDNWEGNFDERRVLIWTLDFTVKSYFMGPKLDKKVIKFTDVTIFDDGGEV